MTEHYVETEQHRAAGNAIAAVTHLGPDEIKIALGEEGNIWPASISKRETQRGSVRSPLVFQTGFPICSSRTRLIDLDFELFTCHHANCSVWINPSKGRVLIYFTR
jgi:hypothetical protein